MDHGACDYGSGHGGSGEFHGGHDCCHDGAHDGQTEIYGTATSGVIQLPDKIEMHCLSHGHCEVRFKFSELARAAGMLPMDIYRPNLMPEDQTKAVILPDDAWREPERNPRQPAGAYPGATGYTRLWRQYYALGKRDGWIFKGPLRFDQNFKSYLEVLCVTRSYVETGDCQTDVLIYVRTLHSWSSYSHGWRIDEPWFVRHYQLGQQVASQLFQSLQQDYPPRPEADMVRRQRRGAAGGQQGTKENNNSAQATVASGADLDNLFDRRDPGTDNSSI